LAWTTTPWTLIGNVACAINEQLVYVKVKKGSDTLILAKDRLEGEMAAYQYEVLEEFKGEKLIGLEYEPLYQHDSEKKAHYIINGGKERSLQKKEQALSTWLFMVNLIMR